jgi:hypothetical protein
MCNLAPKNLTSGIFKALDIVKPQFSDQVTFMLTHGCVEP